MRPQRSKQDCLQIEFIYNIYIYIYIHIHVCLSTYQPKLCVCACVNKRAMRRIRIVKTNTNKNTLSVAVYSRYINPLKQFAHPSFFEILQRNEYWIQNISFLFWYLNMLKHGQRFYDVTPARVKQSIRTVSLSRNLNCIANIRIWASNLLVLLHRFIFILSGRLQRTGSDQFK